MERRLAELSSEDNKLIKQELIEAKVRLHRKLIDDLNLPMVERLSKEELRAQVSEIVTDYVRSERILLNARELENFTSEVIDELTGLGPIEPLLKDPTVSDILINTHEKVYVERFGQLEQVPVRFKDEAHVLRIVNKIVSAVGRRVDESQPMIDARLADGSRINVAVRPIAVDGPLVSIRKFAEQAYDIDGLVSVGSLTPKIAEVLSAAVRARLTILVSRRYRQRQDHAAQCALHQHLPQGAAHHHRGRRRTAPAAAACRPVGNPSAEYRRTRRDPPARADEERAAHAPRPHHHRRGARRGSLRHASGHEYRP